MAQQPIIPYHDFTVYELTKLHNQLAAERGERRLSRWRGPRHQLVYRVALLRTRTPIPATAKTTAKRPKLKKQKSFVRDDIMKALAHVSHYEDAVTGKRISIKAAKRRNPKTIYSVGLPYSAIIARIKRKHPESRVTFGSLRVFANAVRKKERGYANCVLPHKRPYGSEKS